MKLKGSHFHEINYHMALAKEMKRQNYPVNIFLTIAPKESIKEVKKDLQKNYKAKILDYWDMIRTLNVEFPSKNLRKVVAKDYVVRYDFPGVVEVLGCD